MRSERERVLRNLEGRPDFVAERRAQELNAYDVLVSQRWWGWRDVTRTIGIAFELTVGDTRQRKEQRGRPSGAVTDPAFHKVVRGLHSATTAARGRLSLDRKSQKGSIIKALELLKPCLPPRLLPNVLPLGTIENIISPRRK
jgi:hypothetical protein